ncbi:MAG: aminotransferase [Mitsuokella sp.]
MAVDIDLLKAKLKYHKRTYQAAATALGMNRDTFARRIGSGKFTVEQVQGLMRFVPLTLDEVTQIFFPMKKARCRNILP